jgi:hypothetical protein
VTLTTNSHLVPSLSPPPSASMACSGTALLTAPTLGAVFYIPCKRNLVKVTLHP